MSKIGGLCNMKIDREGDDDENKREERELKKIDSLSENSEINIEREEEREEAESIGGKREEEKRGGRE